MYAKCIKRVLDFILSLCALIILSPLYLMLMALGAICMKGNPFFLQSRPGLNERIFKLIKFRTMTNEKDPNGDLLPDEQRTCAYGNFLRRTSLDELPELINILKGDMSIIGPRPLLVRYLPYYTDEERRRHSVRPGLTGYAQAHGRNAVNWEKRFELDVWYVDHLTFIMDVRVICDTVKIVIKREGVVLNSLEDFDEYRKNSDSGILLGERAGQ